MARALKKAGYEFSSLQIRLLFEKFNRQINDNCINYAEFIEEITPRTSLQDFWLMLLFTS